MPGMRVVLNCRSYCQEQRGTVLLSINSAQHTTTLSLYTVPTAMSNLVLALAQAGEKRWALFPSGYPQTVCQCTLLIRDRWLLLDSETFSNNLHQLCDNRWVLVALWWL